VRGHVAFFAGDRGVLIDERIAGLPVVELFERRLPMNEVEVLAIMFQVAANAIPAVGVLHPELGVKALIHRKPLGNFLMAFEAFESRRAGSELVAGVALRSPIESSVCFREGARRDLGTGAGGADNNSAENQHHADEPTHRKREESGTAASSLRTTKQH